MHSILILTLMVMMVIGWAVITFPGRPEIEDDGEAWGDIPAPIAPDTLSGGRQSSVEGGGMHLVGSPNSFVVEPE